MPLDDTPNVTPTFNAAARHDQQAEQLKSVQTPTQQAKERVGAAISQQERDATAERTRAQEQQQRARGPVSKNELEQLEKQREKPAPALQLNPPGGGDRDAMERRRQEREARIKYIQERLGANQDKARDGFNAAVEPRIEHDR